jgi:hypothetical protein
MPPRRSRVAPAANEDCRGHSLRPRCDLHTADVIPSGENIMAVFIEFGAFAILAAAWVLLVVFLGPSRLELPDLPVDPGTSPSSCVPAAPRSSEP